MEAFEKRMEVVKYYTEIRNKHLEQLVGSNGRAAFAVFVLIGSIIIGVMKSDNSKIIMDPFLFYLFGLIGIILIAIAMLAFFHTGQIKKLDILIKNSYKIDQHELRDIQIIPPKLSYYFIFLGLISLLFASIYLIVASIESCN